MGGPKERQHDLTTVRMPGQSEVHALGHRVDEVWRVRDDDAVVCVRAEVQESGQPGRVALPAATPRESRDREGVAAWQGNEGPLVGKTSHDCSGKDGATGRPHIAFRGEHAERGLEANPRHQRPQVARRLLLGRTTQGVLHVVAGEDDEVGTIAEAGSERALFVWPDHGSLDVRHVKDADDRPFGRARGSVHEMLSNAKHVGLDAIPFDVDSEEPQGRNAQQGASPRSPGPVVVDGLRDAEQDRLSEQELAHQPPGDRTHSQAPQVAEVRQRWRDQRDRVREQGEEGQHPDARVPSQDTAG